MNISLLDLKSSDYEVFIAATKQDYMQDKIRNKEWLPADGPERVDRAFAEILPQGIDTAGQVFRVIAADNEKAGYLWYELRNEAYQQLYIYYITVLPEYRRKGIAGAVLELLKGVAKVQGIGAIGLHVFGFNHGAIRLYEQAGFAAKNIVMEYNVQDDLPTLK